MSSSNAPVSEIFGREDALPELLSAEVPAQPPAMAPIVETPPTAQRQTVRDVAVEIQQAGPGKIDAILKKPLSNGGDNYDPRLDKRQQIMLEENDKIPPGGQYIGVNGFGFILRPGVACSVPVGVVEVLNNAIEEVPIVVDERVVGYRQKLRYPYRLLSRPA